MIAKFRKTVSKGSRFNQIYVPKDMENIVEVGDEVEVTLIEKHVKLHYSKNLKKLSSFKENLVKDAFSFLNGMANAGFIFVVGSFLTEKVNYNDIDIVLVADKTSDNFEEKIYSRIIEKFNLKFHILAINEQRFWHLLEICPLTRAMFSNYICNRQIKVTGKKLIDKNHIKFLLMMPYDLLDIKLNSRAFYDNLRRLITIGRFLENKDLDMDSINKDLEILVKKKLYMRLRCNEEIEQNSVKFLRDIIRDKLKIIESLMANGKK